MPQFHDTFLLQVSSRVIPASITVSPEYKNIESTSGARFAVGFTYTTGRPRATADFEIEWTEEDGSALTGVGSTPSNVAISPTAPASSKTVAGKTIPVGFSEPQDGLITGTSQIVASTVQGKIIITQP